MPAVAVVMITYNHEPFIVESIESVFAQRYDGVIHLVVADDCSTDGTQALIADTLAHAPAHVIVHPLLRTSNVGGFGNLTGAWEVANQSGSSYIAILEGDDFWCDPSKLAH
jgi:glycosyltransferase involved in cell wall biosynthesis